VARCGTVASGGAWFGRAWYGFHAKTVMSQENGTRGCWGVAWIQFGQVRNDAAIRSLSVRSV
jgi:hypothetical protein